MQKELKDWPERPYVIDSPIRRIQKILSMPVPKFANPETKPDVENDEKILEL